MITLRSLATDSPDPWSPIRNRAVWRETISVGPRGGEPVTFPRRQELDREAPAHTPVIGHPRATIMGFS